MTVAKGFVEIAKRLPRNEKGFVEWGALDGFLEAVSSSAVASEADGEGSIDPTFEVTFKDESVLRVSNSRQWVYAFGVSTEVDGAFYYA